MAKQQIYTRIVSQFQDHQRADIQKWQRALNTAKSPDRPRNHALQDLYDNLEADGHFIAQKLIRKTATTGYGFSIVDKKTGKIDQKKSELFNAEWFYDLVDAVLESIFKGYTLLELIDPQNLTFELIPRRNVIGKQQTVLLDSNSDKGVDVSRGFEKTLLKIGRPESLGIMANLCSVLIWKRNAQQSWAEFTEKFGMPLITATTNRTTPKEMAAVSNMLRTLGEAAQAALPEGTKIEIHPFTQGDSYMVYDRQIERMNTEMSKPITGGTMITDNGSSRSQSEVHEENLDAKIAETDRRMVQFVVNSQLIPMLNYWGYDINPATDKFLFDTSFELSLMEHWNIVSQVWNMAEIPLEWISKTFNVPIDKAREISYMGSMTGGEQQTAPPNALSRSFQ